MFGLPNLSPPEPQVSWEAGLAPLPSYLKDAWRAEIERDSTIVPAKRPLSYAYASYIPMLMQGGSRRYAMVKMDDTADVLAANLLAACTAAGVSVPSDGWLATPSGSSATTASDCIVNGKAVPPVVAAVANSDLPSAYAALLRVQLPTVVQGNSDVTEERFPNLASLRTASEVSAAPPPAIDLDAAFDEMFDD